MIKDFKIGDRVRYKTPGTWLYDHTGVVSDVPGARFVPVTFDGEEIERHCYAENFEKIEEKPAETTRFQLMDRVRYLGSNKRVPKGTCGTVTRISQSEGKQWVAVNFDDGCPTLYTVAEEVEKIEPARCEEAPAPVKKKVELQVGNRVRYLGLSAHIHKGWCGTIVGISHYDGKNWFKVRFDNVHHTYTTIAEDLEVVDAAQIIEAPTPRTRVQQLEEALKLVRKREAINKRLAELGVTP